MKSSKPSAAALALAVVAAVGVHAQPSRQAPPDVGQASCPEWTVDIDLAPRPGPGRGQYRLVAAVRNAAGGRLQTISLEVAPGQEARSERAVPGGGIFAVEVAVDDGGRGASWSAQVRREAGVVLGQRARVQLGD